MLLAIAHLPSKNSRLCCKNLMLMEMARQANVFSPTLPVRSAANSLQTGSRWVRPADSDSWDLVDENEIDALVDFARRHQGYKINDRLLLKYYTTGPTVTLLISHWIPDPHEDIRRRKRMNEYLAYGAKILSILLSIYISPKRKPPHLEKVVKITSWLLKSYDFTSQYVYNVSNRVKNQNQSNSVKIGKIGPISSFNPQKLKKLLSPYPSPLTLYYIVPTLHSSLPRCSNLKFLILTD